MQVARCWRLGTLYPLKLFFALLGAVLLMIFMAIYRQSEWALYAIDLFLIFTFIVSLRWVWLFFSVRSWKKGDVEDIKLCIDEEETIADGPQKIKLYSLRARYGYIYDDNRYCSEQIYIDEPRDERLFRARERFAIERWIEEHSALNECFVNPRNPHEAVLRKEVHPLSYVGKIAIALGSLIVAFILHFQG